MDYSRETFEGKLRDILSAEKEVIFFNITNELNRDGYDLKEYVYLISVKKDVSILIHSLVSLSTGRVLTEGTVCVETVIRTDGEEEFIKEESIRVDDQLFINMERVLLRLLSEKSV